MAILYGQGFCSLHSLRLNERNVAELMQYMHSPRQLGSHLRLWSSKTRLFPPVPKISLFPSHGLQYTSFSLKNNIVHFNVSTSVQIPAFLLLILYDLIITSNINELCDMLLPKRKSKHRLSTVSEQSIMLLKRGIVPIQWSLFYRELWNSLSRPLCR